MVSTMTFDQLVDTFQRYLAQVAPGNSQGARAQLADFLEEPVPPPWRTRSDREATHLPMRGCPGLPPTQFKRLLLDDPGPPNTGHAGRVASTCRQDCEATAPFGSLPVKASCRSPIVP
jgi:hypothetical protein